MTGVGGFFGECYKSITESLEDEILISFKNARTDLERIKILYPYCKDLEIKNHTFGKNYEEALQKKNEGNSYFAKHEDYKALECYNAGIIKCPSTAGECRKLLAVLIANRSASLYEMKEYEKTLADIAYVLDLQTYPVELMYKLLVRKAKCYSHIADKKYQVVDVYKTALGYLNQTNLNSKVMTEKQLEITEAMEEFKTFINLPPDVVHKPTLKPFISNPSYENVSESVGFGRDPSLGCFAVAAKEIETGTIILDEPAYCAVVAEEFTLTNCQYCLLATDTPVACPDCADIVYCSLKCKEAGIIFHKYECGINHNLVSSGASINCRMALRLITQRALQYFDAIKEKWDNGTFNLDKMHDYYGVYRLCRNEEKRPDAEFAQFTIMAIYLLKLLKTSSYFDNQLNGTSEYFIGSLILRHLQSLQFNAHEVSELRESSPGPLDPKDEPNFKTVYIGGGLYTTLALFNHSCDPSIVRYNIGSRVVVKTIKPIQKGEMICENYGPIYTNCPKKERQKFLYERYAFRCNCEPCQNNWPEFQNMEETELKIRCSNKKCTNSFLFSDSFECPAIKCSKCQKVTNLFAQLKALSNLEEILPVAEDFYKKKEYDEATKFFLKAIKIYYTNAVPPFPDWVKVQQRLRTCIVSEGNKSIEYFKIRGTK